MEIWRNDVNKKGGLLGRNVEFVYYDDASQSSTVPSIYTKLLEVDKVDLVVSGYGTNLIAPAMPVVMRKKMVFPSLFGTAVNTEFNSTATFRSCRPGRAEGRYVEGFLALAMAQNPKPKAVAIVAADAEFALNMAYGARTSAEKYGLKVVYDKSYPPTATDFTPIMRAVQATNPDIVFVGSYPPDSVGILKAANEIRLKTKMFGGGMVGLQFAGFQKSLGPLLNGVVNFDFWVPEPTLNFPGIEAFLAKYQEAAKGKGVDPLGHYLPPYAYAYLEVLGQSVEATKGLDQAKLAAYMHETTFNTVVGKVKFGKNGEWAESRVLEVQFRDVQPDNMEQFAGPGKRIVLYPTELQSGQMIYPYGQ